ncbi:MULTISPECIES: hypothetical protein [Lysinibacillus]|nr:MULTISPECIES: hypothetical protein [Lysinibacillus]
MHHLLDGSPGKNVTKYNSANITSFPNVFCAKARPVGTEINHTLWL